MKKGIRNFIFLISLILLIFSCSTKKDSFINRETHAITTKYNVLYNGQIAFDEAKKQLDETYEDNYWERIPIEPLKIEEEIIPMPGQSITKSSEAKGFDKAEEKSVKAIQKHSMIIDGLEKNKQIDDAYLLLGKSRYFSQRFIPALEAFTFAIEKYPNADLYYENKIWKAKTNIRLQNEELALETLNTITDNVELPEEILEKAHTAKAMAYIQLDSTQHIIDQLKLATYYFKDPNQSSRNLFILGQIYREENKIDSSNMTFESLLYLKKVPRKYRVHAQIERAKNYTDKDSTQAIIFALRELAKDRDNKPFYDELYYQAGLIALQQGNLENAQDFFEISVINNKSKPFQKSLSYEQLGNMYFEKANYTVAGAYYDSVLQIKSIDPNTKRMRKIVRKNKSLEEVIYFENILKTNDSILYLASLSPQDQKIYFEKYVEDLKIKEEQKKLLEEQQQVSSGFGEFKNAGSKQNSTDGKFYFYNVQIVGFGLQEFKKQYGNRPLEDNWIISQKSMDSRINTSDNQSKIVDDTQKFDVSYYLESIPTEKQTLDSISNLRNDAYYNLGLLYKEQFKEYEKAAVNFENYLNSNPNQNLILPVKYHLYKTYENFDIQLSNKYKDDIVNNYPDSRYTQIIQNPEKVINKKQKEDSPENIYKNVFVCYEEGEYTYALSSINEIQQQYKGFPIEAKFELLKAFIELKTSGEEACREQLEFVIVNFPNTEESKQAIAALEILNKKESKN